MNLPNDELPPNEKRLRLVSFAAHAARGLVRDQSARRKAMFAIVVVACVMLFCGSTFLAPLLAPHQRPVWFIFYWAACAWLTATAVLLALFDLLLVRTQGRAARRALAERLKKAEAPNDD
ncbi:MAG: hypothetical protein H0X40_00185 [Chthoniobacterales bacterium]|nr:hypothetical protein [Chthoniobacterales bacterium]